MHKNYSVGDRIVYTGKKYNDIRSAVGFVVAPVAGDPGVYVVEFEGDSYTMPNTSFDDYRPNGKEDRAPTVMPVRRRRSEDEE